MDRPPPRLPARLICLTILVTATASPLAAQERATFEQVLARHATAVGGALAARIPDLRIEGVLEADGVTGRFSFAWGTPDRLHFGWELGATRRQQGWSVSVGWNGDGAAAGRLDVQEMVLAPWLFALTTPRQSATVVEERDSAWVVERVTPFGRRDRFTVERATGRIVRVVTPLASGDSVVTIPGDFRVQQGFHLPYRAEVRGPFGRWVLRDFQYRIAGGVSADLFAPPGSAPDTTWRQRWLAPAEFEVALDEARRRAGAAPASLEAAVAHAGAALRAGQWEEFLRALGAAERLGADAPAVLALRGRRLLWEHRIAEAVPVLRRAAEAVPAGTTDATAVADLATTLYHAGRLGEAAAWYRRASSRREGFARALERAGDAAYGVRWPRGRAEVVVPFVQADPLPVVEVTVNGRRRTFFIDTGASVVFLFPDVVAELGLEVFEGGQGMYAFGTRVRTDHAVLDSLGIGEITITQLPVAVREFEGLREAFNQPQLAGALPLAVFARFLTTMDFPGRRLVLRRRTETVSGGTRVPFLLMGEHYLVVPGRVNGGEPLWFFLDTGFTAGGFLGPQRTLVRGGVVTSGGQLGSSAPLTVQRLEVGPIVGTGIASRSLAFPETLETSTGFRIGGLVSKTFLAPYRVTWDFERREVVFER